MKPRFVKQTEVEITESRRSCCQLESNVAMSWTKDGRPWAPVVNRQCELGSLTERFIRMERPFNQHRSTGNVNFPEFHQSYPILHLSLPCPRNQHFLWHIFGLSIRLGREGTTKLRYPNLKNFVRQHSLGFAHGVVVLSRQMQLGNGVSRRGNGTQKGL